jgi:putative FmdB family regulatory protein
MPLYEYECTQCHRHTETIQKFSDPEITICPHCSGPLERVLSAPAIAFKGGGWFKDGYGSAKPSAPTGEGSSNPGSSGTPSNDAPAASGSDTKAAPAPSTPAPAASAPTTSPDKK